MIELTPITNLEEDIEAILNEQVVENPVTRIEQMLEDISQYRVVRFSPVTRIEQYLANISGYGNPIPEPSMRIEYFLAAIAGEEVNLPTPITRLEQLLYNWYEDWSELTTLTGAIVSFTAKKAVPINQIVVNIDPVQDLSYGDPYLAGGSNNLIPDGTDTSNGYVNGYYLKNDGTTVSATDWYISEYFPVTEGATYTWSATGATTTPSIAFYDETKALVSVIQAENLFPKTFTVPTGAVYCRASQCKNFNSQGQQIESGSTATTPKPYSNICPITGWTGANVDADNKNLMILDVPYKIGGLAYSNNVGTTFTPGITNEGTYSFVDDIATLHNNNVWRGVAIASRPLKKGTYRLKISSISKDHIGSSDAFDMMILSKDYIIKSKLSHWSTIDTPRDWRWNINIEEDGDFVCLGVGGRGGTYITLKLTNIQLELGTSHTEYQRPNNRAILISWQDEAGTVHGGKLTINEDGSVDLVKQVVMLQPVPNNFNNYKLSKTESGINRFTVKYTGLAEGSLVNASLIGKCSHFLYKTGWDITGESKLYIDTQFACFFPTSLGCSSLDGLKTWVQSQIDAGTPLQIAYPLKNPVTYHLANIEQLFTFIGTNNIWADTGDVSVTIPEYVIEQPTAAQALNLLLGGRYVNNGTPNDVPDEDALNVILGGNER